MKEKKPARWTVFSRPDGGLARNIAYRVLRLDGNMVCEAYAGEPLYREIPMMAAVLNEWDERSERSKRDYLKKFSTRPSEPIE